MKIDKVEKLVPNLSNKEEYVVNIRALDQALKHGLVLQKVHRVIRFEHSAWMKPYIDFNTRLRTSAKNKFEEDFFKLMNNSVFGKTMENIRKHKDMKLVTSEVSYLNYIAKPNCKDKVRFDDNFMAVEMGKIEITMNKPIYLGQTILDLSKIVMYEFHYDFIQPKYGDKAELCYMDTDSLIYHIKTEDFYEDIADDVDKRFDTSKYKSVDKTSVDYRPVEIGINKKVIGVMKDELAGGIMTEFVALRAKLFAYKTLDKKKMKIKNANDAKEPRNVWLKRR
jgi:hypothetical protein